MLKDDSATVVYGRKRYRLTPFKNGFRLRSRARGDEFDWLFLGVTLDMAKKEALARFQGEAAELRPMSSTPTLEDVVRVYKVMPKRTSETSAYNNECILRSVVRKALGKELDRVFVTSVNPTDLWNPYMEKRCGGKLDFSFAGRKPEHTAINAAVRQAAAIFTPKLRPIYKQHGISIPADATLIQWLPEMRLPKSKADLKALEKAWLKIQGSALYFAIGLARYAGLRQQEISACRRDWLVREKGNIYVELRDRPEEGVTTKTGEIYRALVINKDFAKELWNAPDGLIAETPKGFNRARWFERIPQAWLKPFTGAAKKPLHRLRGLYADDVKKLTQDAVAAHLAGVKAASQNLGHTNTRTTERSYLSR